MAIDWSLGRTPNIIGNALAAYDEGKKMRREEASRNALLRIMRPSLPSTGASGGIVATPEQQAESEAMRRRFPNAPEFSNDGRDPWLSLTPDDMGKAIQLQSHQATQAKAQRDAQAAQIEQTGRLLSRVTDEASYQQSLAAARQLGLDVSGAPANFDPNWVNQQKAVLAAFDKDGGAQISGLARELQDAGYKQGTPEFAAAMRTALQGKYAPTYTDEQGNMRQGQLPPLPSAPPQVSRIIPQRPAGMTDEQLFAQAHEAVRNGANVEEVFRQLQAWGVNP